MNSGRIYLDHNANSPLLPEVRAKMTQLLADPPANAGSVHFDGQRARSMLEAARKTIVRAISGERGLLTFTSGATEANNLALRSYHAATPMFATDLEHPSVQAILEEFGANGRAVRRISVDDKGRFDLVALDSELAEAAQSSTQRPLVVAMAANNETGNLNPIREIATICQTHAAQLHIDAAQVAGRLPFVVPATATSVTLSAHKAGGPVGVGAVWSARSLSIRPLAIGGHQERGRRSGTEDVLSAVAFAEVFQAFDPLRWSALAAIRDVFELSLVRDLGVAINGDVDSRLPNTSNVSFVGREAESVLMALDLAGISASAGSACTAGSIEVSPVLKAMGLPRSRLRSAVRFSFGPEHVAADPEVLAARIFAALSKPS